MDCLKANTVIKNITTLTLAHMLEQYTGKIDVIAWYNYQDEDLQRLQISSIAYPTHNDVDLFDIILKSARLKSISIVVDNNFIINMIYNENTFTATFLFIDSSKDNMQWSTDINNPIVMGIVNCLLSHTSFHGIVAELDSK